MMNLFSYVKKNGNILFKEKPFNDIDNLVFSSLSYLDFSDTSIHKSSYSLEKIGKEYLTKHKYRKIAHLGIAQKDAYKLLKIVINKKRYKNILLKNYVYKVNKEMQFSAVTFILSKRLEYICFEGTDELISGWREDGELACYFPVKAQVEAINYVNKHVSLFGPNIILGGHSKGGNLALVAGMYVKGYKKFKIKKVYSNDGPGLRKKEFTSREYKKIKKKYIHFVPHSSRVGVLLRNDKYDVVKSSTNTIFSHSMATWVIQGDHLVSSKLSSKSKLFHKKLISWLDKHNDDERKQLISAYFKVLEDANIDIVPKIIKIENILKIFKNIKNIDSETKSLARELAKDVLIYRHKEEIEE